MQRRGLGNSAEVDSFVNYIANDYSDRIDLALQATQGEPAVSSPSKKDSSKQSSIMTNCFTISLNPPTFLCTDRPNEDPSPAQTEDSSESSQFILKVGPN